MKNTLHIFTLSLCFVVLGISSLFSQTGSVKGTVSGKDGRPVEFVNVVLKEKGTGTNTDQQGKYLMDNIEPGKYTLEFSAIGIATIDKTIEVKAGEPAVLNVSVSENGLQLKEVVVSDSKSLNETPVNIGKIAIQPMDLPQSVAVIDKEVLKQQQTLRISDALVNTNGVYMMGNSGGTQEEIAGRGFAFNSSNTFKNGVRYNNAVMPEMTAIERMEVMKGSTAILFGNVAAGGIINLVTKKPQFEKGGEISIRLGSYDFYKPSIDIYGSLNKSNTAAFRINTSAEKSASFRDHVNGNRYYVNPSFLIKLGKKTDLIVEGDYLKDKRTSDFGVGSINYQFINIPRGRFLGALWSYYASEQQSLTSTITHHFNNKWEIRNVSAYQNFTNDLFGTTRPNASSQLIKADGNWVRGVQRTAVQEEYFITQLDVTGRFETGPLKHILLIGADADRYRTDNIAYKGITKYDSINVFDLDKYKQRNDMPSLDRNTKTSTPVQRAGAYLQDLIGITAKLKLLAGVRFSYLENGSNVYTYATDQSVNTQQFDHALTPRFGLVYQPLKKMALFSSYSNSFTPNTGVDVNGKPLAPSYINQYEAGIKNDLFKGLLSANLTVYQIVNSNLAQMSLLNGNNNTNIKELAGEVTSKGLEVDIMSKPCAGVSLIAGYSYNDTRYTKSNTYIVGSKLKYNPGNTANASIYYTFNSTGLKGLNAGLSVFYMGDRAAGRSTRINVPNDTYKLIPIDAYTQLDFSLGYVKNNVSFRMKISNITNVLSYQVHDDNSVNPIAPRQFAATMAYRF